MILVPIELGGKLNFLALELLEILDADGAVVVVVVFLVFVGIHYSLTDRKFKMLMFENDFLCLVKPDLTCPIYIEQKWRCQ